MGAVKDLRERPGVLSAAKNQHGLTVVCASHGAALEVADDIGGNVERDRLWTVRVAADTDEES